MNHVFLVQHVHKIDEDEEDVKVIGVYRSMEAALEGVRRLSSQPGFSKYPDVIDYESTCPAESGFSISKYELDQDSWAEGFITVLPNAQEQDC